MVRCVWIYGQMCMDIWSDVYGVSRWPDVYGVSIWSDVYGITILSDVYDSIPFYENQSMLSTQSRAI